MQEREAVEVFYAQHKRAFCQPVREKAVRLHQGVGGRGAGGGGVEDVAVTAAAGKARLKGRADGVPHGVRPPSGGFSYSEMRYALDAMKRAAVCQLSDGQPAFSAARRRCCSAVSASSARDRLSDAKAR